MDPTANPIATDLRTTDPIANARRFVADAVIPTPRGRRAAVSDTVAVSFTTAKDQAIVVGSEVISFVSGVTAERREAIVNSSLLAQLVANTKVTDPVNIDEWYQAYFTVLMNVGWVVQETNLVEHRETAANFEAHKAILAVATTLFGPASTALALVTTTINALHSIDENTPWITIFNRESQAAQTARFQVGLATQEADGGFLVSLMAFGLKARTSVTQVLFFKARASEATLRHRSSHITINTTVLDAISDTLKRKLVEHANRFVSTLPDLA
jgi:hypothetical protein